MAILIIASLTNLYTAGIQGREQALANTLAGRLNAALELGIELSDFENLNETFADYKKNNPDLSIISLTLDDEIAFDTDPNLIGKMWVSRLLGVVKDFQFVSSMLLIGIPEWHLVKGPIASLKLRGAPFGGALAQFNSGAIESTSTSTGDFFLSSTPND